FSFVPNDKDPLAAFAIVPAITLASWISFLISERFDAYIYDKLRSWIHSKSEKANDWWKYLWIRNVFSDILSLGLDTLIFIPLAFFILPSIQSFIDPSVTPTALDVVVQLIAGQLAIKWFLGIVDTPFMYLTRWIYNQN
ncbi:MAG: queuosine precursor transporter, partial [Candidatus Heimdallarchaeota archaeon]|nr:queuosine precursor transporter [Candidatus Heimdallarchaeota archaeon]